MERLEKRELQRERGGGGGFLTVGFREDVTKGEGEGKGITEKQLQI